MHNKHNPTTRCELLLRCLQVHLTFWSCTTVLVSWATCDAVIGQTTPVPTNNIRSVVYYGKKSDKLHKRAQGHATSYAYDYSGTVGTSYASPVLHHVLLTSKHHTALVSQAQHFIINPALKGRAWNSGNRCVSLTQQAQHQQQPCQNIRRECTLR
jgi:hypothetical protein